MIGFRRYFVFVFKRFTRGCIIKIENKKHNFKFRSPVPNHMLWRGSYSQFSVMAGCVSYLCWAECRRFLQSLAPPMPRAGFDEIYGVHMYVRIYIVLRIFSYIPTSYVYWRHLVIYIERLWYGIACLFQLYSLWLLYYNLILTISIHTYIHCVRVYVEASSSKPRTSFWRGYVIVCQTFDSRHHSRLPVASHAPPRWRHPSKGFILDRNSTSGKI